MRVWYERARLWIVYASILIVVAVLYLGSFLSASWKNILLPAALGVLIAFFVQSLQNIERQSAPSTPEKEYEGVMDAVPELQKIAGRDREVTDVKVIAATGWTTVRDVLPAVCSSSGASSIQIRMHVIEGSGPLRKFYPEHWTDEVKRTVRFIRNRFTDPRLQITVSAYKYPPPVHGLLLNNHFLLIGFFGWTARAPGTVSPELTGSQLPHRLYKRGDAAAGQLFDMFEEWFQHVPRTVILDLPRERLEEEAAAGDHRRKPAGQDGKGGRKE